VKILVYQTSRQSQGGSSESEEKPTESIAATKGEETTIIDIDANGR